MPKKDISVIGPINLDIILVGEAPHSVKELRRWEGLADIYLMAAGSVGYVVQDLTKLNVKTGLVSLVSNDDIGTFICNTLQKAGVRIERITKKSGTKPGIGVYILLFGSRKRPMVAQLPTHKPWPLNLTSAHFDYLLDSRLLHCGGYLHFEEVWHGDTVELFKKAREHGLMISLDPQFPLVELDKPWITEIEDILPYVDILFVDETEATSLTLCSNLLEAGKVLRRKGPKIVIIKQGSSGSLIMSENEHFTQPAVETTNFVDSIGAGDAYDSAFLAGFLENWSIRKCAQFATVVAAETLNGIGGISSMPNWERAMKLYKDRFSNRKTK